MKSSVKKIEQNKYEMSVELNKEELAAYVKRTEDRIVAEAKVDGFRQGKAPREMIRKQVGEKFILEQALDAALQGSLSRAIDEEKLEVIQVSELDIKENSASRLHYLVKLTLFPEIKLADLSKVKVHRKDVKVESKEIDDALDFVAASRANFVDKEEPVKKGDRVEIDFEVTSGGLPVEGGVSKNHPLIVGDNKFIPGFEEQLIGMKKDEEKKFSLKAPADYFHKSVAGKELDFSVKIAKVQSVERPVLNDDFAKGLGRFDNLVALKQNIEEGILEEKKVKEKQRLRLEILSKIFETSKVDVPTDLIDEKLNNMLVGFDNDLHMKGMELSFYLAHLGKTEDDLKKDWRPEAEKQAAYSLLLRKIAKDNNIRPLPEEIDEEANKMIQVMMLRGEAGPEGIDIEKLKEAVAADMTNEKTFTYLESHCLA